MTVLTTLAVNFGRLATFIQVLFYLPLALDIAGQDAFLALSASLASYYLFLSTVRLLTRGTRLAWLGRTLAAFQFVVIPACLLVCCNVYSPPSATIFPPRRSDIIHSSSATEAISNLFSNARSLVDENDVTGEHPPHESLTGSQLLDNMVTLSIAAFFWLARRVPGWWHTLLRYSSPFFSLLEGVASLLVIQSLASTSRWIIASSLTSSRYQEHGSVTKSSKTPSWISNTFLMRSLASIGFGASEVWQIFFLLVSATIYVTAFFALYVSFDSATKERPGIAAAIATSVTSTLWLTAIAFAIRKGNVIETSLMFAYVVFNIYQLGPSLSFTPDPISLIRSFKVNTRGSSFVDSLPRSLQAPLPSKILQTVGGLAQVLAHWLGQSFDFLHAAGAALPKSVIVSLIYRLMVLYAATRILPMLKSSISKAALQHDEHRRKASWGRTRRQRGNVKENRDDDHSDWSSSSFSTSSSSTSSSSDSDSQLEEVQMEVWDADQRRWVLQKPAVRNESRRRHESYDDKQGSRQVDVTGSFSNSGTTYADEEAKQAERQSTTQGETTELSLADKLKSPPPPATQNLHEDLSDLASPRRRVSAKRVRSGRNLSPAAAEAAGLDIDSPLSAGSDSATAAAAAAATARKRPGISRPPSMRSHKRSRPSTSPSSHHIANPGNHFGSTTQNQASGFGSFISILVSYSRFVLIAVYSHLLLLDQKNQIYWRFLTVGLTLFLWALEIFISKDDDLVGPTVADLASAGAGGSAGMLAR